MQLRARLYHDLLPPHVGVLTLSAREGLSRPFDLQVELLCDDPDIDLDGLIWSTGVLQLVDLASGWSRAFHGAVEEAEYVGEHANKQHFRLRLRPLVHGLAYRIRSRIFQDKDVIEVVKAVLKDAGIPDDALDWRTTRQYSKREYCVQWKESELAFVSRLLEEEGIFFWFEHSETGHVMVFGDTAAQHRDHIDGDDTLAFSNVDQDDREVVTQIVYTERIYIDAHATRDWNWKTPSKVVEAEQGESRGGARYEYPGWFDGDSGADRHSRDRLDEDYLRRWSVRGTTNCPRLVPGRQLGIVDALPEHICGGYTLLNVDHVFVDEAPQGTPEAGKHPPRYRATFHAVPADVSFRPPRTTPRPRVSGKESAVVTGPAGEEIHVDEFGRIKVHFFWDREGKIDDTATCWIRVQQLNTVGSMILPRIGWEVDVGFLDGSPDRPIVLQKTYNAETLPPYALPDNKTQGSLQSATSPGGGSTNEVRLQDSNGGMEFFVHASKDMSFNAGNNASEDIAVDCKEETVVDFASSVGADETVSVGGDQSTSVTGICVDDTGADRTVKIGPLDDWGITGPFSIKVDGARSESIGSIMVVLANKVSETFNATCDRKVGGAFMIAVAASFAESVGAAKTEFVGAAKAEVVGKAKAENMGVAKMLTAGLVKEKTGADISVTAKGAIAITTGGPIKETVGGNFSVGAKIVTLTAPAGLQLKAGGVTLKAQGGKVSVEGGSFTAKGTMAIKLKGKIKFK